MPTLEYLERQPKTSAARAPLLFLLHGRGAYAKTIFSIEGLLDSSFHIISIQAPYPSEIGGFEWFHPMPETGLSELQDAERFEEVERLLTDDISFHLARTRLENAPLFLWGFSQGAAMSLIVGLRGKIKPTGIVPMSGFLPRPVKQWDRWNTDMRVLLAHGSDDEVLATGSSKSTRTFLESIGVPVEYYEYKGRHKMTLDVIGHVNQWMLGTGTNPHPTAAPSAGGEIQ